jgi:hypothetical protein
MFRKHPDTIRWRQLSPLLVLSLALLALASPWSSLARSLFGLVTLIYSLALLAAGVQVALRERRPAMTLGVPLAIATMHLTWGTAFLWSLLLSLFRK